MLSSRKGILAVAACVMGLAAGDRAEAQALGFFHMPSTAAQYMGWGYGAGHHAPIVCTPAQRPSRAPRIASPGPCVGPLGPAPYEPIGCYGDSCSTCAVGASYMQGAGMTPAQPVPRPLPTAPTSPPVAMRPVPFGWR